MINPRQEAILRRFPSTERRGSWAAVPEESWSNWVWQQQNRIRSLDRLQEHLILSDEERNSFLQAEQKFRVAITPYYLSLMDPSNASCPIRRQAIPQASELIQLPYEREDPSQEDKMSPVPGIVHRYPDRVLFYTTHHCAVYCRFCTRKRKVSDPNSAMSSPEFEAGFDYIRSRPEIREVILSGGDALSNSDERLAFLLEGLSRISHVEIIRIGSRNLVTLPQRITRDLAKLLASFAPIYFHTHFNHPKECTREAAEACALLADAGIPLNNHTVLLKGINDDAAVMKDLNLRLLMMRVRPYYLYQCDQVAGNSAFRTSVSKGLDILKSLRGWTSGLAIPHYVLDTAGGGKVPLLPNYVEKAAEGKLQVKSYRGETFEYEYED